MHEKLCNFINKNRANNFSGQLRSYRKLDHKASTTSASQASLKNNGKATLLLKGFVLLFRVSSLTAFLNCWW